MLINVEENLIEQNPQRNSNLIEDEIETFLETNEGQNIKTDIDLLCQMGFDKKMINKVYILLRPENIERAIDYMTEIDGIYQHDFIASSNPKEKNLCFICKKPKQNHLDFIPDNLLNEGNNNLINNNIALIHVEDNIIQENENDNIGECEVCYDEIKSEDKELNALPCRHLFCTHCWQNYLKTLILEAKVENIKCMDHECKEYISDEFILKHISKDNNLIEKYKKFMKRAEILKDKNKKICPKPDCDSYLQKSELTKYVQCENGHKYCFECLKAPHGKKSCDYNLEKDFQKWTKGKRVKRCPRCKMYTEKNEGCNHMTCVNCKYQWCWLCEGKYVYGHYDSGKCRGHQFTKADNLKEIRKKRLNNNNNYNINLSGSFGLQRIFPCVFQDVTGPFSSQECWLNYLYIFGFWFFSVFVVWVYTTMEYMYTYRQLTNINRPGESMFVAASLGMSFCLFVCFQISLSCIITPFILICLVYHKFYYRLILFFGMGKK